MIRVEVVDARAISPAMVSAWSELESRCLEPNVYLSPDFVLPAVRHLGAARNHRVSVLLIRRGQPRAQELIGVGVFRFVMGTRFFPLPHLVSYDSPYSLLSGLLLDRERAGEALGALFDHLRASRFWLHGLEFKGIWGDGPLHALLDDAIEERATGSSIAARRLRATLIPDGNAPPLPATLKRRLRRLEEQGEVRWTLHRHGGIPESSVEAFLALEHSGWKGESGTSLRSNPADERFFREVVARCGAAGKAFFSELSLDGKVIASTSNFVSGDAGFAFKSGWLPDYAKMSPGVLNELELVRTLPSGPCSDLRFLDSGAAEGSYMDKLWSGRRWLLSTSVASTSVGSTALVLARRARAIKRRIKPFVNRAMGLVLGGLVEVEQAPVWTFLTEI